MVPTWVEMTRYREVSKMDAYLADEDEDYIKIYVTDNLGSEHELTLEKVSGEIPYHQCENYADKAADRTVEDNEYVEQARRFARYYVAVKRGYDTVPRSESPERIEAVRVALQELSDTEFERLFAELSQQLRSHFGDTDPLVTLPNDVAIEDSVFYRQNVYLGIDPKETVLADEARDIATAYGIDLSTESVTEESLLDRPADTLEDWQSAAEELVDIAEEREITFSDGVYVDAVSSLYLTYFDGDGDQHTTTPERDPHDHGPDATIELPPVEPGPTEEFRAFVDHHLKCQVRDCFIQMGVEPPEEFRVLGNGRMESMIAYRHLDIYPEYHEPKAGVSLE